MESHIEWTQIIAGARKPSQELSENTLQICLCISIFQGKSQLRPRDRTTCLERTQMDLESRHIKFNKQTKKQKNVKTSSLLAKKGFEPRSKANTFSFY